MCKCCCAFVKTNGQLCVLYVWVRHRWLCVCCSFVTPACDVGNGPGGQTLLGVDHRQRVCPGMDTWLCVCDIFVSHGCSKAQRPVSASHGGCACDILITHGCGVSDGPGGQTLLGVRVVSPSHVAVCVLSFTHSSGVRNSWAGNGCLVYTSDLCGHVGLREVLRGVVAGLPFAGQGGPTAAELILPTAVLSALIFLV